ncbi:hypothetical protein WR25_26734 [Diploscapter pachys]|uniref:Spermatogenesis-associated protein 20-like TRX domain-containing protein n=1 Tax=Diploscapter pachys TaxID=2018661 RepID=A0A2A2JL65_9BILA|nr:hypothetical protein WR25_26734 [Diploscapter pachys]
MSSNRPANRLANERSPYLLQHAHNPVDWYAWGEEAFNKAQQTKRPIFLSIGYSTCHWCHVMEKESFENDEIAQYLNEHFVSIKVDREERPDVDKLYMDFVVALMGHGGWPLSVFLTPTLEPIMGGTYFPPDDRRGFTGFKTILKLISKQWNESADKITEQGQHILQIISKGDSGETDASSSASASQITHKLYKFLSSRFDPLHGGFGSAPKFPKTVDLEFLEFLWMFEARSNSEEIRARSEDSVKMLQRTLGRMAAGGIRDHVGGGFHRYSVDGEWHVPHFEKMLYDQSQLLCIYADFCLLTEGRMKQIVREISDYMISQLRHKEGGFYAAEDADSLGSHGNEKLEGAFYVWEKKEIVEALSDQKFPNGKLISDAFMQLFDVKDNGNVSPSKDPQGHLLDKNVLRIVAEYGKIAEEFGVDEAILKDKIDESLKKLKPIRDARPRPHLDSKLVAAWQGMAISGLAKASSALKDASLLQKAEECAEFVEKHLKDSSGYLRVAYVDEHSAITNGSHPIRAFAGDYAFVVQGLIDLFVVSQDVKYLKRAFHAQKEMNDKFWHSETNRGYFINEKGDGKLPRMIEEYDGAEPCATSVGLSNCSRLADLLLDEQMKTFVRTAFTALNRKIADSPHAIPKLLLAYKIFDEGTRKITIVGSRNDQLVKEMQEMANSYCVANTALLVADPNDEWLMGCSAELKSLTDNSQSLPFVQICQGHECLLPIRTVDALQQTLDSLFPLSSSSA